MVEEVKTSKFETTKKNFLRFIKELKNELKKVIWPNKTQLINNTVTVLLSCFIVGCIIWIADSGLEMLRSWIYNV